MIALAKRRISSPLWLLAVAGGFAIAMSAQTSWGDAVIDCVEHCLMVGIHYPEGVPHPH